MAHRKNVKRIDPRYFLHETVNRGEEIEEAAAYPRGLSDLKVAQIAAWKKRRADNEAAEKERIAAGGEPKPPSKFTQRARANYQAKLKAEKELEEGCPLEEPGEGGEAIDISAPGTEVHVDDISQLSPEEAFAAGMAAARDAIDQVMGGPSEGPPGDHPGQTCEEAHPGEPHAEE